MNNKYLLTAIAIGFWALLIVLCVHFFDFSNIFKSDNRHEIYMESFNNRLSGTWMRTSDSLKVKYINNPTNSFIILNTINYIDDKKDTSQTKIGYVKFDDIEVTDTINNVYDISYLRDGSYQNYINCTLFLINDSNMIIKRQGYDISDSYIKLK